MGEDWVGAGWVAGATSGGRAPRPSNIPPTPLQHTPHHVNDHSHLGGNIQGLQQLLESLVGGGEHGQGGVLVGQRLQDGRVGGLRVGGWEGWVGERMGGWEE